MSKKAIHWSGVFPAVSTQFRSDYSLDLDTDEREAQQLALASHNLQPGFTLSGLGALAEAALTCDRMVQF